MTVKADQNNEKLKACLHNLEIKLELLDKDDECPFCLEAGRNSVTLGNIMMVSVRNTFTEVFRSCPFSTSLQWFSLGRKGVCFHSIRKERRNKKTSKATLMSE
jgi:hypothetical protein